MADRLRRLDEAAARRFPTAFGPTTIRRRVMVALFCYAVVAVTVGLVSDRWRLVGGVLIYGLVQIVASELARVVRRAADARTVRRIVFYVWGALVVVVGGDTIIRVAGVTSRDVRLAVGIIALSLLYAAVAVSVVAKVFGSVQPRADDESR
jgi:hypothetical protein